MRAPPDDVHSFFGSSIMRISYGIEVDEEATDYIKMAEDTLAIFSYVFVPGKFLVETFPILRFVPAWMPGAKFKRDGKEWVKTVYKLVEHPWQQTMDVMKDGSKTVPPSMASGLIESILHAGLSGQEKADAEEVGRNATAAAYAGTPHSSRRLFSTEIITLTHPTCPAGGADTVSLPFLSHTAS